MWQVCNRLSPRRRCRFGEHHGEMGSKIQWLVAMWLKKLSRKKVDMPNIKFDNEQIFLGWSWAIFPSWNKIWKSKKKQVVRKTVQMSQEANVSRVKVMCAHALCTLLRVDPLPGIGHALLSIMPDLVQLDNSAEIRYGCSSNLWISHKMMKENCIWHWLLQCRKRHIQSAVI